MLQSIDMKTTKEAIELFEYKRKEFIGDGIASFICRILICTPDSATNYSYKANRICSNANFAETAAKLRLKTIPEVFYNDSLVYKVKPLANAYEVALYEYYIENGLDKTIEFFKKTAISNYEKDKIEYEK